MATWSSRRKTTIALSILIIILGVAVALYFLVFYKAPTCFDRIQNGGEFGVDCGGKCVKLCQSAYLPTKIAWGGAKFEQVGPGLYNVAALVINPNTNAAAVNVPYRFSLYDNRGVLIMEKTGKTNIPAHRNVLVFQPAINTSQRTPTKATFEFIQNPIWFKSRDTLGALAIGGKKYAEDAQSSSLEVTIENESLIPIRNVTVGALLTDIDGNVVGFSQTRMDNIPPQGSDIAPFTWPFGRKGKVVTIEALPVVEPIRI